MQVQISTDKNIEGSQRLETYVNTEVKATLSRFEDHITRLDIHLSDENGGKVGVDDNRCLIEARIEKMHPIAVTAFEGTPEKAFYMALDKMKKVLYITFDKLREH